jgi:hypothetical protein
VSTPGSVDALVLGAGRIEPALTVLVTQQEQYTMKTWNKKADKKAAREALFTKEIADDLMAQIAGGQNKSGCHPVAQ